METRRGPSREKKSKAPYATVRAQGKVNRRLKAMANAFLEKHPDQAVRFVYDPLHKPELSNVINRQADGYRLVRLKELGEEIVASIPGQNADDSVRVGDVVLMAIEAGMKEQFQAEINQRGKDELSRVEQEFYDSVKDIETREEYKPRPRGRSVTEEVEKEVDVDPTLKDS